jgi:hypothetical protein
MVVGHVYVVAGDMTRVACDAWLLPTDDKGRVSGSFAAAIGLQSHSRIPGLEFDGQRVVRHPNEAFPKVWLGDVGRVNEMSGWYTGVIEPFVTQALEALGPTSSGCPRVLAVNVLGTGEGGKRSDKGAIHPALLPTLIDAVTNHDVDLLLVCWGRRAYSAAQRARRDLMDHEQGRKLWELGTRAGDLSRAAALIANHALDRNLVLFMGAGVSAGAGLPAWQALLDRIAVSLDYDDRLDLDRLHRHDMRDQAAILENRLKRTGRALHTELTEGLKATGYAITHALLASLEVREAVTTNYDQLFEAAVKPVDGDLAVLPYQPVRAGQRWLLKIHGSIDQESVVITRDDYLSTPVTHGALFALVQAMLITRHMLFVGYSLKDEDFHQVMHEVRLARAGVEHTKCGTVLTLFEDPLFEDLWSNDLEIVPMSDEPSGDPTPGDVARAARTLTIFLDLVGFLASDLSAFLLDPTYQHMLTSPEKDLAGLLAALSDAYLRDDRPDLPAWRRVGQLLDDLGARSTPLT